jgi:hypothetical protein
MSHINNWYFNSAEPLPKNIIKPEWAGKEVYVFRREHPDHGVMWINVIASDGKEARKIISDITK